MQGRWLEFWNTLRNRLEERAEKIDRDNLVRNFIQQVPANIPYFEIHIEAGINLSFHGGTRENPHPDVHLDVTPINRFEEIMQHREEIEENFGNELGWGNGTTYFPIYFHLTQHDVIKKKDYMLEPNLWSSVINDLIDSMIRFYNAISPFL
jgi:hypothetical protein